MNRLRLSANIFALLILKTATTFLLGYVEYV